MPSGFLANEFVVQIVGEGGKDFTSWMGFIRDESAPRDFTDPRRINACVLIKQVHAGEEQGHLSQRIGRAGETLISRKTIERVTGNFLCTPQCRCQ